MLLYYSPTVQAITSDLVSKIIAPKTLISGEYVTEYAFKNRMLKAYTRGAEFMREKFQNIQDEGLGDYQEQISQLTELEQKLNNENNKFILENADSSRIEFLDNIQTIFRGAVKDKEFQTARENMRMTNFFLNQKEKITNTETPLTSAETIRKVKNYNEKITGNGKFVENSNGEKSFERRFRPKQNLPYGYSLGL